MKTNLTALTLALLIFAGSGTHAAALGTAFQYQGKLDSNGQPANGTYVMHFALFDAAAPGGTLIGQTSPLSIGVTNGLFTAELDFGGNAFNGQARWLEISVAADGSATSTTLAPRQQLTPTPYALYAPNAGAASTASGLAGTLPDTQLSGNVALRAGGNTFTGNQIISSGDLTLGNGKLGIGQATPTQRLDVGGNINYSGQLTKLDVAESPSATVRAADLDFGSSSRHGLPGRAFVDWLSGSGANQSSTLVVNFQADWPHLALDGNVGIGNWNSRFPLSLGGVPGNTKLAIWDDGANALGLGGQAGQLRLHLAAPSDRFSFFDSPNGNELVTIQGNGHLGIGTSTPQSALDVNGDGRILSLDLKSPWSHLAFNTFLDSSGPSPAWKRIEAGPVSLLEHHGDIGGFSWLVAGNGAVGDPINLTLAMHVATNGNVGLGTLAPAAPLDIRSADVPQGAPALLLGPPQGALGLRAIAALWSTFTNSPDKGARRTADIVAGFDGGAWGTEYLSLNVGSNGLANDPAALTSEKLRITGNGKVGIGTTTPQATLDVAGTVRATELELGGVPLTASGSSLSVGGQPVLSGPIQASLLATNPGPGQVLGYDGKSLVWQAAGGASSVWSLNGNSTYYNNGNVGIATPTPQARLDVNGNVQAKGDLNVIGNEFFGFSTRQMLNLFDVVYGIGVQDYTLYQRTAKTGNFAWYAGGVHTNAMLNPGTGGIALMSLDSSGNQFLKGDATINGNIYGNNSFYLGSGLQGSTGEFVLYGPRVAGSAGLAKPRFSVDPGGNVSLSSNVWFGAQTRQMLNLFKAEYGMGVQNNAEYFRTANEFFWYKGGTHNDTFADAGGGATLMRLGNTGTLVVSESVETPVLSITGGADVAEPFSMSTKELPAGTVVIIDDENPGQLKMSERAYDTRVAGIVSGANGIKPGISLNQRELNEGGQNVALSGRVYVMAEASSAAIKPGDLLTTSDIPGRAMKATDSAHTQGAVLGKAMSGLKEGQGMVLVLVSLQ